MSAAPTAAAPNLYYTAASETGQTDSKVGLNEVLEYWLEGSKQTPVCQRDCIETWWWIGNQSDQEVCLNQTMCVKQRKGKTVQTVFVSILCFVMTSGCSQRFCVSNEILLKLLLEFLSCFESS